MEYEYGYIVLHRAIVMFAHKSQEGLRQQVCYSQQGVLVKKKNEAAAFCCTGIFTALQSASQPCASLTQWHNMVQGVSGAMANELKR